MIRAAAKNHASVCVVVDPQDYASVLADIAEYGGASHGLRRALAAKAFARTAAYDAVIANWFAEEIGDTSPHWRTFAGSLVQTLRYGENPHQRAAKIALACASASGATTTSVMILVIAVAVAASTGPLRATTPPKALTGSQRSALA